MDKREFLNRLQMQLAGLTREERQEALEYYEEYFADAGEENEADVLISLGTPEQVAEQIKAGLHKADEGMFTENGYREKVESDNPPELYGQGNGYAQGDRRQSGYTDRNGTQYQNGCADQGGAPYQNGHAGQDGADERQRSRNGQSGYGYQGRQAGKKKNKLSGGMIVLLVILCIFAAPVLLGVGVGIFGVILGILGAVFGVVVGILAVVLALLVAGVTLFVVGFSTLFYDPFAGMLCIAYGCIVIALFILCVMLLVVIFGKFFPWLIREVESFGKYLGRKWSERKQKGGETA